MKLNSILIVFTVIITNQTITDSFLIRKFDLISDLIDLGHIFIDSVKAFRVKNGDFMINDTFIDDVIKSCEEIKSIDKDYSFFGNSGICPNVSDIMMTISAAAKVTVDPLIQAAVIGMSVTEKVMSCRNKTKLSAAVCYLGIAPPALKDVKILIFSVKQYISMMKLSAASIKSEIRYCNTVYKNLSGEQKELLRKQWLNDNLNQSDSCAKRAENLFKYKLNNVSTTTKYPLTTSGSTSQTSTQPPSQQPSQPPSQPSSQPPSQQPSQPPLQPPSQPPSSNNPQQRKRKKNYVFL